MDEATDDLPIDDLPIDDLPVAAIVVGVVAAIVLILMGTLLPGPSRPEAVEGVTLSLGEAARGEIGRGGTVSYGYEAGGGEVVAFTVRRRRDGLDPYLRVYGPAGEVLAEDDDGAGDLNSRVELRLPVSGTYRFEVSGLGDSAGAFEVELHGVRR